VKVLAGRRALVTGSASGIGRAIALALARERMELFLVDINAEGLEGTAAAASTFTSAVTHTADLRHKDSVDACISAVLAGGGVDLLVNSAGLTYVGPTEHMTDEQAAELVGVNLEAPLRITQGLLPSLLSRKEAHILNVCSFGGLVPHFNETLYSLTKYALVGYSQALRLEYGDRGLGVTAICPGLVKTNLQVLEPAEGRPPAPGYAERLSISPERVAATAIDAVRRNRAVVVGGVTPHALWLLNRLFPPLFDYLHFGIAKQAHKQARSAAEQVEAGGPPR
jgi:3-oxoacyl-[acyl-carrier protein] reductase